MKADKREIVRFGCQTCGVKLVAQPLPHGRSDTTAKCPAVYIKTFGWALVPVARDDFGVVKEVN